MYVARNRSALRGVHSHMTDRTDTRALRTRVDAMLDALTRQNDHLTAMPERLAAITAQVRSADDLVGVMVDGTGVPVRVEVAPDAFRRSTPEQLGDAVTTAAQRAAAQAREIARELVAPVLAVADEMPDLSDLVPGAPSLRHVTSTVEYRRTRLRHFDSRGGAR